MEVQKETIDLGSPIGPLCGVSVFPCGVWKNRRDMFFTGEPPTLSPADPQEGNLYLCGPGGNVPPQASCKALRELREERV